MRTPLFWHEKRGWKPSVLAPFSLAYGVAAAWKWRSASVHTVDIPVVCVGNLVMGGAGKTPVVLEICRLLSLLGHTPHVLSRGYGGYLSQIQVDPSYHTYLHVGDEALLLASSHPTWVGKDRVKSARAAMNVGASLLLMDDGFQNPSLKKNCNILVVDALQGFGNGRVFPSGPLRETLKNGLSRADAIVIVGDQVPAVLSESTIPLFFARFVPTRCDLSPGSVVAFTGLGFPQKFKNFLLQGGYTVVKFITFPDHHPYTVHDMEDLLKTAKRLCCPLITTDKDLVRVPERYGHHVHAFSVQLIFQEEEKFLSFLKPFIEKHL